MNFNSNCISDISFKHCSQLSVLESTFKFKLVGSACPSSRYSSMIVILYSAIWRFCGCLVFFFFWFYHGQGYIHTIRLCNKVTNAVALKQKDINICWKINCYLVSFLLGNKIRLHVCNFGTKIHNLVVKSYTCSVCKTHLCMQLSQ